MSHTIRVDVGVYNTIIKEKRPGESVNEALRRLLAKQLAKEGR